MEFDHKEVEEIHKYKECFERVFRCKDGQIVLKVLSDKCFSGIGTYNDNINYVAFQEGKRNVLLQILKLSSIDIQEFLKEYQILKTREYILQNSSGEEEWTIN